MGARNKAHRQVAKKYYITQSWIEPHFSWQNRAETEISFVKRDIRCFTTTKRRAPDAYGHSLEHMYAVRGLLLLQAFQPIKAGHCLNK